MTKYEWETELKKCIHRLPPEEIKRVTEYYSELFEDHIERGKTETQIINEFGNPVDVAFKILSEYDSEANDGTERTDGRVARKESSDIGSIGGRGSFGAESQKSAADNGGKRDAASMSGNNASGACKKKKRNIVRTAGNVFKTIGIILLAVLAVALIGGGAYTAIVAMGVMARSVGSGMVHLSIGAVSIGAGIFSALPLVMHYVKKKSVGSKACEAVKECGNEDKN